MTPDARPRRIDRWLGRALTLLFGVMLVATTQRYLETRHGFAMDSFDEFGVIELGGWAQFMIRAFVVEAALGLGASALIVRSGGPGWRALALLFLACALVFVWSYLLAPDRIYPPVRAQVTVCVMIASLCWWMGRGTSGEAASTATL